MRLALSACLLSLVIAGCTHLPKGGVPEGTYRESSGSRDALVIEGMQVSVYLPELFAAFHPGADEREFAYQLNADGSLRLWSSSNDNYFLHVILDCDWRWTGAAIECARKDGTVKRFTRNTSGDPLPPATPEQQVWLAIARKVRANEMSSAGRELALSIYHETSFPTRRAQVTQLEKQARKGFCGLAQSESAGVVRSLRWQNKRAKSIGDVFEHRPEFSITDRHPSKGDYLGLSHVVFNRDGDTAYVNADIGGLSGSIVQAKLVNGAWTWAEECATWVSWR
jgi:hypothetical protein